MPSKVAALSPEMAPDLTGDKQAVTRFKPGQSGNPAGRPRGARNRLAGELLEALADDFSRHGITAIEKVRATDPTAYLRILAGLLPREVIVAALHLNASSDLDDLITAGEFAKAYRLARQAIGAKQVEEDPPIEADFEEVEDETADG
jgi:Family of unknown function (DUF5681)